MIYTYNPRKVTCALGAHNVTGFAEDSMITVSYAGDGTSHVVGADGEIVRSIDPTDLYGLKLTLQQTSKTNQFLREQYEKDQKSANGVFAVNIKDILGNKKFTAESAWVVKPADFGRGKTQKDVEWELMCAGGKIE